MYKIRFYVVFALFAICKDCLCDNKKLLTEAVTEMCVDIPHGIYTLSIVQTEFASDDRYGTNLRNDVWFGPEVHASNYLYKQDAKRIDERLLDYYCLMDNHRFNELTTDTLNNEYPFETEQTISGYVSNTFKKVNNFVLKVFIPSTGEIQDLNVEGNRFNLRGLDFYDETTVTLQAVKPNGSDRFLELHIDTPTYPKVSVKKYHIPFADVSQIEIAKERPQPNTIPQGAIALPEVEVKGRFRPMNRMKADPDRYIKEDDPLFEIVQTIEGLVYRFGLRRGFGAVTNKLGDDDELIEVESLGSIKYGRFTPCEVMLNDNLLSGYELEDVLNINPLDIKQIEYFLPSNYEMFGNLAGLGGSTPIRGLYGEASKRGLLMIWTKSPTAFSRFKHNKPLSVATVKQLGSMRPKVFDTSEVKPFSPTKYWNPHFIPQEFDGHLLDINLMESANYMIKIEGISDEGILISKQRQIDL